MIITIKKIFFSVYRGLKCVRFGKKHTAHLINPLSYVGEEMATEM